jgi:hypothetical protein
MDHQKAKTPQNQQNEPQNRQCQAISYYNPYDLSGLRLDGME